MSVISPVAWLAAEEVRRWIGVIPRLCFTSETVEMGDFPRLESSFVRSSEMLEMVIRRRRRESVEKGIT